MRRRFGVSGLVAGLVLATTGPAQTQEYQLNHEFPNTARCNYYRTVFDNQSQDLKDHPDYQKALYWRVQGGKWCVTGRTVAGQNALKGALNILGIAYQDE